MMLSFVHPNDTYPSISLSAAFGCSGGESFVKYGMCPRDKSFPNDDMEMKRLAYAKLRAFDSDTHGQFFWNFRTEFEPRWDYAQAVKNQWLPSDYSHPATKALISSSCIFEGSVNTDAAGAGLSRSAVSAAFACVALVAAIVAFLAVIWRESLRRSRHSYITISDPQAGTELFRSMTGTHAVNIHPSTHSTAHSRIDVKEEVSNLRRTGPGGIDEESTEGIKTQDPQIFEVYSEKENLKGVQSNPALSTTYH